MKLQSRRRGWRRANGRVPMILSAVALAFALVPVVAVQSAQAVVGTSPDVGAQGFPLWYEDANGTSVDLCLDSARDRAGNTSSKTVRVVVTR